MSPLSSSSTRRPRSAASRATPHPLPPAPTTTRSNAAPEMSRPTVLIIFDFRFLICDLRVAVFKSQIKNLKSKILPLPVACALDGAEPAAVEAFALGLVHPRL